MAKKSRFELAVIQRVKEVREQKKLGQRDIAAILGVSEGFIGQIESPNSPSKYNLNHLNLLAKELHISPREFLPQDSIF
jgi:putative transcriptional regulator